MKKIFILGILIITILGCFGGFRYGRKKPSLRLKDQSTALQEINVRIDGAWIDTARQSIMILYRNGIRGFVNYEYYDNNLKGLEEFYQILLKDETICRVPYGWGLYKIQDGKYYSESWISTSGIEPYPIIKGEGEFSNNGTELYYRSKDNPKVFGDQSATYHFEFYEFPKPDSCMRWFEKLQAQ